MAGVYCSFPQLVGFMDPYSAYGLAFLIFAAQLQFVGYFLCTVFLYYFQAKDRIQYYQTGETFIFPYDTGSKWKNFKQVFTWSGIPEGDGLDWPVRDGCHQYSLTVTDLQCSLKLILPTIQLSAFLCSNIPDF